MKIFILDVQDGNGCRLVTRLSKDAALQEAQDWLNKRPGGLDPAFESWFNDCMDTFQSGAPVQLANGDRIALGESEIDLGFVTDVLEDAQHTMGKLHKLLGLNLKQEVFERAKSSFLTSDQAIHLTLKKLKGQP